MYWEFLKKIFFFCKAILLHQGQVFSGADYRVYLLGNPVGVLCQYFCKSFSMIPKLDKWKQMVYHGAICFLLGGCILSFWAFRGLSYGMSGPMAHLPDSTAPVYKWMDSWEV
ncbi:hypothetical protein P5673_016159 [Acropora cervicornis]|uniref:Uncharacterized protein n=1 Tax=Acropora cervicornis TaxID=6130 RepID=A0AAD9QGQ5_ACRCE|nr:hypothetical protein P5673_016159 [Acropora cervicornis]